VVAVRWAGWPACYFRPTANPTPDREPARAARNPAGGRPGQASTRVPGQRPKSTAVVFAPLITTARGSPAAGW
jgi:hypothetical protein